MRKIYIYEIDELNKEADEELEQIDNFIAQLESARDNANAISANIDYKMERLTEIKKKCDRVEKSVVKVLK